MDKAIPCCGMHATPVAHESERLEAEMLSFILRSYGYATAPQGAGVVGDEERFQEQKGARRSLAAA